MVAKCAFLYNIGIYTVMTVIFYFIADLIYGIYTSDAKVLAYMDTLIPGFMILLMNNSITETNTKELT